MPEHADRLRALLAAIAVEFPEGPPYPGWLQQCLQEPGPGLDAEALPLCAALNEAPGIRTTGSCCGHGKGPFLVFFSAAAVEALVPVAYAADGCHCGHYGWRVMARTDCSMQPVFFVLEGPAGPESYEESANIAKVLREAVKELGERDDV